MGAQGITVSCRYCGRDIARFGTDTRWKTVIPGGDLLINGSLYCQVARNGVHEPLRRCAGCGAPTGHLGSFTRRADGSLEMSPARVWCGTCGTGTARPRLRAGLAEDELRRRNRELAESVAARMAWHEGTCAGCGTECEVSGSGYCSYCEELRELGPLVQPSRDRSRRVSASVLLGCAGTVIALASADVWMFAIAMVILTVSYLLASRAA